MPLIQQRGIHVIARAVVRVDGLLLVARCKGASNTFLPGGHVETGERMHDAIARELGEEFGRQCVVGDYLGAIEHSFSEKGETQHEVNHFFRTILPDVEAGQALPSLEEHLEFFWQPIGRLDEINLKPDSATALIESPMVCWGSTLKHGA